MQSKTRPLAAALLLLLITLAVMFVKADKAHADPVVNTNPDLYVVRIVAIPERPNQIWIKMSNGDTDVLKPCRYEDGRHCYWNGGERGNHHGQSFLVTRGRIFYVEVL